MKSIRVFKEVIIGAALIGALAAVDVQAQTADQSQQVSSSLPSGTASRGSSARDSRNYQPSLDMRGGYNVGRTVGNVPGCTGPVSFCNLYFGS